MLKHSNTAVTLTSHSLQLLNRQFHVKQRLRILHGVKKRSFRFIHPAGSVPGSIDSGLVENQTSSLHKPHEGISSLGPIRYLFSLTMPLSCVVSLYSDVIVNSVHSVLPITSVWKSSLQIVLSYSGLIFPFLILPTLDWLFGRDEEDPPRDALVDSRYRLVLYSYIPVHLSLLLSCCFRASFLFTKPVHFIGVGLSIGTCGGVGFTVVHELIHGTKKLEEWFVNILLCVFLYMHYSVSHLAHHIKVGTFDDAGTARLNESFYQFLPRAVYMSVRDGIWMEKMRLRSHDLGIFSSQSKLWSWLVCPLVMYSGVYWVFGSPALLLMTIQAFLAITMLEVVNYIEHYGLTRDTINGKLEQVTAHHSWNADWFFTSALTFQLQRHAHHHMHSSLPYQGLKSISDGPALPMSYPGMMLASFVPPVFFRKMNPLVEKQRNSVTA
eukprot:g75.t1